MKGGALIASISDKDVFLHTNPPFLTHNGFDIILNECVEAKVVQFGAFGLVLQLYKKKGHRWPLQTHLKQDIDHLIVKLLLVSDNDKARLVFENTRHTEKEPRRTAPEIFLAECVIQRSLEQWCLRKGWIPICASCIYFGMRDALNPLLSKYVGSLSRGKIGVICMQSIEDQTGKCKFAWGVRKTLYPFMRRLMFTFLLFGYRHNDPHLRNLFLHGDCAIIGDFGMVSKLTEKDHAYVLANPYESGDDEVKKRWFEILYGLTDPRGVQMNCRDYFYKWKPGYRGGEAYHNVWVKEYQWMRNDSDALDDRIDVNVSVLPFADMNERLRRVREPGTPLAAAPIPIGRAPVHTAARAISREEENKRAKEEDIKGAMKVDRILKEHEDTAKLIAASEILRIFEEAERRSADAERRRADAERRRAEAAERQRAEAERRRADERQRAEAERRKAPLASRDGIIMKFIG